MTEGLREREGSDDYGNAILAKIHVVDDEQSVRRSLAALFRSARIPAETYPDAIAFLDALPRINASHGCVVTDVRMPRMDGIQLLRELRSRGVALPVVLMTGHGDISMAVRAMKAGALDFIEKPFAAETMLDAVRRALWSLEGGVAAEQTDNGRLLAQAAKRIAALSAREREVLDLLARGKPNKVIAHDLGLSPRTVEMHRAHMMERLGVRSLSEAVRVAVWADLARPEGAS